MSADFADIKATAAWKALTAHHDQIADKHLREFFAEDPDRGRELTLTVGDLYVDYSKHRVTRETLRLLTDLARAAKLEQRRDAMLAEQPGDILPRAARQLRRQALVDQAVIHAASGMCAARR